MSMIHYTTDHEYVRVEGDIATVGISNYAQEQLGDVVFVELPEAGRQLARGEEAAVVESVKAASEINAPVSGEVIEANTAIEQTPETINQDPLGAGWFIKIRIADTSELGGLMDEAAYEKFIKEID